jgi:hypothetical protein
VQRLIDSAISTILSRIRSSIVIPSGPLVLGLAMPLSLIFKSTIWICHMWNNHSSYIASVRIISFISTYNATTFSSFSRRASSNARPILKTDTATTLTSAKQLVIGSELYTHLEQKDELFQVHPSHSSEFYYSRQSCSLGPSKLNTLERISRHQYSSHLKLLGTYSL